jgi:hypothetical protein
MGCASSTEEFSGGNISGGGPGGDTEQYIRKVWADGLQGCNYGMDFKSGGGKKSRKEVTISQMGENVSNLSARERTKLIQSITRGMSQVLKVSPPTKKDDSSNVAHLMKITPNPRKNKSIIADASKQAGVCSRLADVINENYSKHHLGSNIIDKTLSPDGVCNQVAEIVETLSAGVNEEYVVVAASVRRLLTNLNELASMVERSYEKLHTHAKNSSDEALQLNSEGIKSMHNLLMTEIRRQISLLSNITGNVLKPADRDMAALLSENKDFKGLVFSIKNSIGTSEWGDKLGYWLSGVSNLAQVANRVNKSLKIIGMSAKDYKNSSKLSDLITKAHELESSVPVDEYTKQYATKFTSAVQILKNHHGRHDDLVSKNLVKGGADGGCGCESFTGGRVKLANKLKQQQSTRLVMLRSFKTKTRVYMDRVYQSIVAVGKQIGSGKIRPSDELYRFKTILGDMSNVFTEGIEYALTGYYSDSNSTQKKQHFLSLIQSMLNILEPLKSNPSFRDVASNLEAMVSLMDFYADKFSVHTGKVSEDRVEGGGEFKAVITLANARRTFDHFYNIAKFKHNLKAASSEMKGYNKNYTEVVGAAVGTKISALRAAYTTAITELARAAPAGGAVGWADNIATTNKVGVGPNSNIGLNDAGAGLHAQTLGGMGSAGEWSAANISAVLTAQLNAKEKLYKVAQAVDEYLQKFTDAVATSPDDVQEVAKLLGNVELVANWFDEKSGDSISSLFEIFPWGMVGMRTLMNSALQNASCKLSGSTLTASIVQTRISTTSHYYKSVTAHLGTAAMVPLASVLESAVAMSTGKLANNATKTGLPGNPFLPISPARALFAHKFAKYTVEKIYVLKNIVSAFAHLGRKFNGVDLTKETFMSPSSIYKNLVEYLYVSALSHGWGKSTQMRVYGKKANGDDYDHKMNYHAVNEYPMGVVGGRRSCPSRGPGMTREQDPFLLGPYFTPYRAGGPLYEGGTRPVLVGAGGTGTDSLEYKSSMQNGAEWPGTEAKAKDLEQVISLRRKYSCVMSGIESQKEDISNKNYDSVSGWKSQFYEEDLIFVNIIKAMAAKVFTVTGLYNMLNFSTSGSIKNYALSPTRLIMGGGRSGGGSGSFSMPKIYPDAVELYARLPLLAEFYRDIFCFEEACDDQKPPARNPAKGNEELMISMVPEVGSMWAGLITTIFEQPINTNGLYTENVMRSLIHDINKVFLVFKQKGSKSVVADAISDFVAEINSRYGLMNRTEVREYTNAEDSRRTALNYGDAVEQTDFDILDDDNISSGIAPSDRYLSVNRANMPSDYTLDVDTQNALREFRRRIDNRIASIVLRSGSNGFNKADYATAIPDFGRLIMSTRDQLADSSDPQSQFNIVKSMMYGIDVSSQRNEDASLMYHESVVAPLAVLTSITNMLNKYRDEAREWDAASLYRALETGLDSSGGLNNSGPLFNYGAANVSGGALPNNKFTNVTTITEVEGILRDRTTANKTKFASKITENLLRDGDDTFLVGYMGFRGGGTLEQLARGFKARDNDWENNTTPNNRGALTSQTHNDFRWNSHVAYMFIRWEACFKHIINAVYGLSADLGRLCEVSFQGGKIVINHTKLQTLCEELTSSVRANIDKFRGVIPATVIDRQFSNVNTGSLMWVHDNLISKLFADSDGSSGLKRAHVCVTESLLTMSNFHPDRTDQKVSYYGLQPYAAISVGVPAAAGVVLQPPFNVVNTRREFGWCIDGPLSEMTHYNAYTASSVLKSGCNYSKDARSASEELMRFASLGSVKISESINDPFSHVTMEPGVLPNSARSYAHPAFQNRINFYLQNSASGDDDPGFRGDSHVSSVGGAPGYRLQHNEDGTVATMTNADSNFDCGAGLLVKFNEVMAHYISQFWDASSSKIYAPLIDVPANGPLNLAVFKAQGHPDNASTALSRGLAPSAWTTEIDKSITGLVNVAVTNLFGVVAGDNVALEPDGVTSNNVSLALSNVAVHNATIDPFSIALAEEVVHAVNREHKNAGPDLADIKNDVVAAVIRANPAIEGGPVPGLTSLRSAGLRAELVEYATTANRVVLASQTHSTMDTYGKAHKLFLMNLVDAYNGLQPRGTAQSNATCSRIRALVNSVPKYSAAVMASMTMAGDPTELLYSSLGNTMRVALNEVTRTGQKANVIQSIAEVPLRVKESMKAQLPVFSSMFGMMSKRSDLLKTVLRLPLGVDRMEMVSFGLVGMAEQPGIHGRVTPVVARDQNKGKAWYTSWLDKVSNSCDAMVNNMNTIANELNDAPLFLETMENSISDYKNKTSALPLMPLSTLSVVLAPTHKRVQVRPGNSNTWVNTVDNTTTHHYRLPNLGYGDSSVGEPRFMFNYGGRLLLNDQGSKPQPEHMPGVSDIVETYNRTTQSKKKMDPKLYSLFACSVVELFRYAAHTKAYAPVFGASRAIVNPTLVDQESISVNSTYQLSAGVSASLDLTTNSDKKASRGIIATHVDPAPANNPVNRRSSMIYNLLDLNISPINVHAMRREIPLANLFNYAYTFDSFVTHSVKSTYDGTNGSIKIGNEVSTHDVLGALCKNPYIQVPTDIFYSKLEMLVSGNSTIDQYGYPKFISDQLWGKALLQDTVLGKKWFANAVGNDGAAYGPRRDRLNIRPHWFARGPGRQQLPRGPGHDGEYRHNADVMSWNKNGKREPERLPGEGNTSRQYLAELGRLRFDTKFARNMMFLANVQRLMTSKIEEELTVMQHPVISGPAITNRKLTDYNDGETMDDLRID